MRYFVPAIIAVLALAVPVQAQAPATAQPAAEPKCPADAQPIPPELASWKARTAFKAGGDAAALQKLPVGKAVDLALLPTPSVHYALRPERPGGSVSSGGMVSFTVDRAGTYRVALDAAPWIDIVRDGQSAMSGAHGPGPTCSGIRKMVDFALQPGTYVLQIAGSGMPTVSVLVARLPG